MALNEAESEDARIDYIASIIPMSLGVNASLWGDFIWKEDNQLALKDFFDTPSTKQLFIYLNEKGQLVIKLELPPVCIMPDRCVYFQKYDNIGVPIPISDFKSYFMCGTLDKCLLKQFESTYDELSVPVVCNSKHSSKWPQFIAIDISTHLEDFHKALVYYLGQAEGKVALPIPEETKKIEAVDAEEINSDATTKDSELQEILDAIGTMVVDWTFWINEILVEDCGKPGDVKTLMTEVNYWEDRKHNLGLVSDQLNDPLVQKMLLALKKANSCYHDALVKLIEDVAGALKEATDIAEHFSTLREPIEKIDNSTLEELIAVLPDAMHVITESWMASTFFRILPSRIALLVQKICTVLIKRIHTADSKRLFKDDRSVSKAKIELARGVVGIFVESYKKCRENMESFTDTAKVYPWEFPDNRVFISLKAFTKRLEAIQDIFAMSDTYHQIPSISLIVLQQIPLKFRLKTSFEEFCKQYKIFEESKYDPLDVNNKTFEEHYNVFSCKTKDIDQQLGTSIGDACIKSVLSKQSFELMDQLKNLLSRPEVESEFEKCVQNMILKITSELLMAKEMYNDQMNSLENDANFVAHRGLPRTASSILWSTELKNRIVNSVENLKNLEKYFIVNVDADIVSKINDELVGSLQKFEDEMFSKWTNNIDVLINEKLDTFVIIKDEEGKLSLNYDLQMSELMSEIKMLKKLKAQDIPDPAKALIAKYDGLHFSRSALFSTIGWFNQLSLELMDVEKALIKSQWDEICKLLVDGEAKRWNDSGLQEFATQVYEITKVVYDSVEKSKENINAVQNMIKEWSTKPLYVRPSSNKPVDFKIYMTPVIRQRYNDVIATSNKMSKALEENLKLYKCDRKSGTWKSYVAYLESIIEDGLTEAIVCSFNYLFDNTSSLNTKLAPFIIVELELEDTFVFIPPLDRKMPGSLVRLFEAVIEKIYSMGSQIKRLTNPEENYEKALVNSEDLSHLKTAIVQHVVQASNDALLCVDNFKLYSDFWIVEIEDCLEDFLIFGPPVEQEEYEEEFAETPKDVKPEVEYQLNPPTEEEFRNQISQFELLYRKVETISQTFAIESWLVVDATSFKASLLACIKQWITTYKQKLIEQKSLGKLRKVEKDEGD